MGDNFYFATTSGVGDATELEKQNREIMIRVPSSGWRIYTDSDIIVEVPKCNYCGKTEDKCGCGGFGYR